MHYENNAPILTIPTLTRLFEVSHWGNLAVEDHVSMRHDGASLRGPFSRYEYQMNQRASGISAVKELKENLPSGAVDVYYRDDIGNISTSHFSQRKDKALFEFQPRFPIFGGWKTEFYMGYNLPLGNVLTSSGSKFELTVPFGVDLEGVDFVVDHLVLKFILPEGASNMDFHPGTIKVDKEWEEKHFTYLDISGRPVYVVEKKNVAKDEMKSLVKLSYTFHTISLLAEPAMLIVTYFLLLLAVIVYNRFSISISGDERGKETAAQMYEYLTSFVQHVRKAENAFKERESLVEGQLNTKGGLDDYVSLRSAIDTTTDKASKKIAQLAKAVEKIDAKVGALMKEVPSKQKLMAKAQAELHKFRMTKRDAKQTKAAYDEKKQQLQAALEQAREELLACTSTISSEL